MRIPTRYIITKQPHSRTQQVILWTTSRAAGVFITTQQTISAFHFHPLCFARLRLCLSNPCTKSVPSHSINSPLIPSLIHSLHSSLFYAMNTPFSHSNEIICASHSTIEWDPLFTHETRISWERSVGDAIPNTKLLRNHTLTQSRSFRGTLELHS